jgi:hypothetical protein
VIGKGGEGTKRREVALTVLDETDEGPVEAGESGEFLLRYLLGFAFFLENFAKDLFSVLCPWMNRQFPLSEKSVNHN